MFGVEDEYQAEKYNIEDVLEEQTMKWECKVGCQDKVNEKTWN